MAVADRPEPGRPEPGRSHPGAEAVAALLALVRDVPDFPGPGVLFRDITPLLADPDGLTSAVDAVALLAADLGPLDVVVGIEARGFILAAPVAYALGAGFVPVRKAGKLPHRTLATAYTLEYGEAVLEVHEDGIRPGARVLVVDDVLATGGTAAATAGLVRRAGGVLAGIAVLIDLAPLGGRQRLAGELPGVPVRAVLDL